MLLVSHSVTLWRLLEQSHRVRLKFFCGFTSFLLIAPCLEHPYFHKKKKNLIIFSEHLWMKKIMSFGANPTLLCIVSIV